MVVSVNDEMLPLTGDFLEVLGKYPPRTRLTMVVSRDGSPVELAGLFDPTEVTRAVPLFLHDSPHGRVDLVRNGNTVAASTQGVSEFTVLVSPDSFDFARPIKVTAGGRTLFEGLVKKDVATLMKWAARDNDRTMLFGAEVHVKVAR